MNVGLSSACFYPEVLTENSIKLIRNIGFSSGEIFLNSVSEYEEEFINGLNREKEKYSFNVNSVHSFSPTFEPFLFELYSRRRQDMLKLFKKVCAAARILGAKYYTFHGLRKTDFDSLNKNHIIDVYNELLYNALEEGVVLAQENVSWCMSSDIRFLNLLKEKCKYPVKFTLDIKQSFRAGHGIQEYIDVMGRDLVNVHINDKDEKNICLLPGHGNVDYEKLFRSLEEIGYGGDLTIEVYRDNFNEYKELEEAKEFLIKKCDKKS